MCILKKNYPHIQAFIALYPFIFFIKHNLYLLLFIYQGGLSICPSTMSTQVYVEDMVYCRPLLNLGRVGTANHCNYRKIFISFSLLKPEIEIFGDFFFRKKSFITLSFALNISSFLSVLPF